MTLTAEKLPFSGDTFQQLLATVDRMCADCGCVRERHEIEPPYPCYDCSCVAFAIVPSVHTTCQWEQEGYAFPCGRKAHHTCTVCEVTQCDRHDCGCER